MPPRPPKPPDREAQPRHRRRGRVVTDVSLPRKRTLRELSRQQLSREDASALESELRISSDRSTCIILSSLAERNLESAIMSRIYISDTEIAKPLFDRDGALSTFYGNIYLAYALGMIDAVVRDRSRYH
jgi:hypothetical protein